MPDAPAAPVRCDLRSDTVTRPDAAMRRAMAAAEVGDDVYGEDPEVNRLESELAAMLGKEAGLFLPSGTQSNLVAILTHCGRGDEAMVGAGYHVFRDEAAGAAVLGGVALLPLPLSDSGGVSARVIAAALRPDDVHYPVSRLLCLENTVGGRAVPLAETRAAAEAARRAGLSVHLDGARFFNAVTALGCGPADLAGVADTVSVCLSKGLGAPVGTVLVGPAALMARARRQRKILGGGMRQAGILAAAGRHALACNRAGLAGDHARAAELAGALSDLGAGAVSHATNMVFFTPDGGETAALRRALSAKGVLIGGQPRRIRMVLHRDVEDSALAAAIEAFRGFYGG
ncbi:MAG: low-specificity L-threonine aldolase [Rhodobacteraceae bacterium]|nr:low-specificity L-threonine aldolase [Paracoccaceae bacterium]MCP5341217.1 low-specificity L-threonine aldolase [Paracoccaceae bacterium]